MSRSNSDRTSTLIKCDLCPMSSGAMRFATCFAIVFAVLNFVNALPFPQFNDDGREGLAARDAAYYGFPLFWYRRPIYDDGDDDIVNGGQVLEGKRRSSTVSYINAGAGWGR